MHFHPIRMKYVISKQQFLISLLATYMHGMQSRALMLHLNNSSYSNGILHECIQDIAQWKHKALRDFFVILFA